MPSDPTGPGEGASLSVPSGVSEASFYLWKKKYAKLGLTEIRELRQLRDENARLKGLVGSSVNRLPFMVLFSHCGGLLKSA